MIARRAFFLLALAALVASAGCARQPSQSEMREWDAEIARLQAQQDSLRAVADSIVARDPRVQRLPKGDIVISVPTQFIREVVGQVFEDVAGHVTLQLSGIKAHVSKPVKKIVTIGQFTVDVDIQKVLGKLHPETPRLDFVPTGIALRLPVDVNEGTGRASIHFIWDGKNVAGAACGDMDVTQVVTGNVIPSRYLITGSLLINLRGKEIVCTPRFPETRVQIRVKPSKESWAAIDSLLNQHGGLCKYVIDKVNVPKILEGVVQEKGFSVKLPLAGLKPFVIPAGVQDSVTVGERSLAVETATDTIRVDPDAILYSARVTVK